MSLNAQVQVKKRKSYSSFVDGNYLVIERLCIEEDYVISRETGRPTNQIADTRRNVVKQYIMPKMSVEDVTQWRSEANRRGIIFVKNGKLYAMELSSRELKGLYKFLCGAAHLCGTSKLCCTAPADNPKNICPYIRSSYCTNIERYVEFIKDGFEIFGIGQNHSIIYVCTCTRIPMKKT